MHAQQGVPRDGPRPAANAPVNTPLAMRQSGSRATAFGAGAFVAIAMLNLSTRDWGGAAGVLAAAIESSVTALIIALLIGAGALLGFGSLGSGRTSLKVAVIAGGISGLVLLLALELLAQHVSAFKGPVVVGAYVIASALIAAAIGRVSRLGEPHG